MKMLNMETKTKLSPEEVIKQLKEFFGKGGAGLNLTEESSQCLNFEGGGGYVNATVCSEGGKTSVSLVTQEWEYQVKKFLAGLS